MRGCWPVGALTHLFRTTDAGLVTTVELDDRRRAPLAKIARAEDRTFLAEALPDGRIILTPAEIVTKSQSALNIAPGVLDAIDRSYAGHTVSGTRPQRQRSRKRTKAPTDPQTR